MPKILPRNVCQPRHSYKTTQCQLMLTTPVKATMNHIVTKCTSKLRFNSLILQTSSRVQLVGWQISTTPCSFTRLFSMSSNPEREYLVVVPDFPGTTSNRAKAQPAHIEKASPLIDSGKLSYFGVTMDQHVTTTEDYKAHINGSVIVMKAESEKAIIKYLEEDAYTKEGVWDVKKAQIWPFKSG